MPTPVRGLLHHRRLNLLSVLLLALPLTAGLAFPRAPMADPAGLQAGWPVQVASSFFASPAVADLSGDGLPDVIAADVAGMVHAWRHDGTYLEGWPRAAGGAIYGAPAVGDVDGDGAAEVVVATLLPPRLVAYKADGTLVPGFPFNAGFFAGDSVRAGPALGQLDTDPALEIVAGSDQGLVFALDAPGAQFVPGWPQSVGGGLRATPVLADLDRDGLMEVLIRQSDYMYVLDAGGRLLSGWPRAVSPGYGSPAVADVNGDGAPEIVVLEGTGIFLLRPNGTQVFRRILGGFSHFSEGGMGIADLAAAPGLEIVFAGEGGRLYMLDSLLNPVPGWPVQFGGEVGWAPIAADLDGDRIQEILVGTDDGMLHVLRPDGTEVAPAPLPVPEGIRGALAVGDLDGDNAVEVVSLGLGGAALVLDFPGPWDSFWAEWPQAQAMETRSGTHRSAAPALDADGDGDPDASDCAPNDPAVHHRATEACNGLDDDCDDSVDDLDGDGDGFGACSDDCDDGEAGIYPGAPQLCDGVNNDCDDAAWPAAPADESDADFDTWRICAGDCDDTQAAIRPGGSQLCGDGFNNDCLHPAWPALTLTNETDDDGDGMTECAGDCDDARTAVYAGAPQVCGDGLNNDCLAPGWPVDLTDTDGDGDGLAACQGDCDDTRATVIPGAPEICDGRDNDCDGVTPAVESDADGDGTLLCAGDCDDTNAAIRPGGSQACGDGLNNDCSHASWPSLAGTNEADDDLDGHTECAGDCDDTLAAVYPGAPQTCGDAVNNDCLDPVWPTDLATLDRDADGFTPCEGDCDDLKSARNPGAAEICDGLDNDCDLVIPAGELDGDLDTFSACEGDCDDEAEGVRPGAPQVCGDRLNNDCSHPSWPALAGTNESDDDGDTVTECSQPPDCDDSRASVYPGAPQVCGDGVNNDCLSPSWPGVADEIDQDQDGFGLCGASADCNDTNPFVYPGAVQNCGDGVNNDCLDPSWPDVPPNEADTDNDTFTICEGDCDDSRGSVYPTAPQLCGDGVNNNCLSLYYPQLRGTNEGDDDGDGATECQGDCDDTRGAVYTGAPQVCDGVNNNCAAPGWPTLYGTNEADDDGDGWSVCEGDCATLDARVYPGAAQVCGDGVNNDCLHPSWPADVTETDDDGDGQAECPTEMDCDDANAAIYAFAPQVCGDGLNNDCRHPSWPALAGTNETDDDGDGRTECSAVPDCNDTNGAAWGTPTEAREVYAYLLTGGPGPIVRLTWSAPTTVGANTVVYDTLRSTSPWNFTSDATCLETGGADQIAGDAEQTVPILNTYFYLIRPRNACPGAAGVGPLGHDSTGAVIPGRSCP